MKKYILICLLAFQLAAATEKDSLQTLACHFNFSPKALLCDACGCSASGGSMGFASMLNANFVGLRYYNQQYQSTDGLYSNSVWYKERYNTIQVWARIPVYKKVQLSVLVPYHFHNRETVTGSQSITGLGDATVIGMYQLLQTEDAGAKFSHTVQIGGGLKIPTGKFNQENAGNVNPSFQLGTGSWDFVFASEYVVKKGNIGLNVMGNYILKTQNSNQYRFGNQVNYASTFFYLYEKNQVSFTPQLGFSGEIYQSNSQYSQTVRKTSGDILFGKVGFELGKKRFSLGANLMLPLHQNLASERLKADYRWSLNFNYSL